MKTNMKLNQYECRRWITIYDDKTVYIVGGQSASVSVFMVLLRVLCVHEMRSRIVTLSLFLDLSCAAFSAIDWKYILVASLNSARVPRSLAILIGEVRFSS